MKFIITKQLTRGMLEGNKLDCEMEFDSLESAEEWKNYFNNIPEKPVKVIKIKEVK